MSRLRIIRDGAYSWLDEGPGRAWSGRISGSLLIAPSKARPHLVAERHCERCGERILGRNNRALFCSRTCQNRAKAERQRARRMAA